MLVEELASTGEARQKEARLEQHVCRPEMLPHRILALRQAARERVGDEGVRGVATKAAKGEGEVVEQLRVLEGGLLLAAHVALASRHECRPNTVRPCWRTSTDAKNATVVVQEQSWRRVTKRARRKSHLQVPFA